MIERGTYFAGRRLAGEVTQNSGVSTQVQNHVTRTYDFGECSTVCRDPLLVRQVPVVIYKLLL